MTRNFFLEITFVIALFLSIPVRANFLDDYPDLKKLTFQEPRSSFYVGFGMSPITVLQSRSLLTLEAFELHWVSPLFDIEILNASLGFSFISNTDFTASRHFVVRTSPKIRIFDFLSFGPLFGYEYVNFPNVGTHLTQGGYFTRSTEPFSSAGPVYGFQITETLHYGEKYLLKIGQSVYRQTYSAKETTNGWAYSYEKPEIENDPDRKLVKATYVVMLEVSLLF